MLNKNILLRNINAAIDSLCATNLLYTNGFYADSICTTYRGLQNIIRVYYELYDIDTTGIISIIEDFMNRFIDSRMVPVDFGDNVQRIYCSYSELLSGEDTIVIQNNSIICMRALAFIITDIITVCLERSTSYTDNLIIIRPDCELAHLTDEYVDCTTTVDNIKKLITQNEIQEFDALCDAYYKMVLGEVVPTR